MLKIGICPEMGPFSTLPYNWFFILTQEVFSSPKCFIKPNFLQISLRFLPSSSTKKRSVRSPRAIQFSPHPCEHVEVVGAPRCEKKHRRCCRLPQKSMMG